jgi:hypothetical protein
MRIFEILIFIFTGITLILQIPRRKIHRLLPLITTVLSLCSMAIHLLVEKTRWQMLPILLFSIGLAVFVILRDRKYSDHLVQKSKRWVWITFLVLFFLFLLPPILFPVPFLPEPTGPYSIGTTSFYWVDKNRPETLSPTPGGNREIMVQVWYPAQVESGAQLAPYMEQLNIVGPVLAKQFHLPSFLLSHLGLAKTHSYLNVPLSPEQTSYPVLVFSHGWTGVRTQNTYQAENLASHGYIVIAPDHAYGAGIVVFPDGHTVLNNPKLLPVDSPSEAEYDRVVRVLGEAWVGDLQYVLDQTERLNTGDISSIFNNKLDLSKIGFYGHSTGGGAVIETCSIDPRCKAGLTEDAWMLPFSRSMLETGLNQPFFFMQSEKWSTQRNTGLFNTLYSNMKSPEYKLVINGTRHYDFTDIPLLTPLAPLIGLKGPINGQRGLTIINDYTVAFYDQYLKNTPSILLEGQSPLFPETVFTRTNIR